MAARGKKSKKPAKKPVRLSSRKPAAPRPPTAPKKPAPSRPIAEEVVVRGGGEEE